MLIHYQLYFVAIETESNHHLPTTHPFNLNRFIYPSYIGNIKGISGGILINAVLGGVLGPSNHMQYS